MFAYLLRFIYVIPCYICISLSLLFQRFGFFLMVYFSQISSALNVFNYLILLHTIAVVTKLKRTCLFQTEMLQKNGNNRGFEVMHFQWTIGLLSYYTINYMSVKDCAIYSEETFSMSLCRTFAIQWLRGYVKAARS